MKLLQSVKPVLRLPFRNRAPAPFTQSIRTISSSHPDEQSRPGASPSLTDLSRALGSATLRPNTNDLYAAQNESPYRLERQPWHLHCYSTKHNTHLALTKPNRDVVISISAGQIGFKKAQRGSYDAAYQLGAYMMARLQRLPVLQQIDDLEFVMRGFGQGREAFVKILTGSEGSVIRHKVTKVTDATRLKIGGTRSPRPRRLG